MQNKVPFVELVLVLTCFHHVLYISSIVLMHVNLCILLTGIIYIQYILV